MYEVGFSKPGFINEQYYTLHIVRYDNLGGFGGVYYFRSQIADLLYMDTTILKNILVKKYGAIVQGLRDRQYYCFKEENPEVKEYIESLLVAKSITD